MNSAQAWLDRTDPRAKQLVEGNAEDAAARREQTRLAFEAANRAAFLKECARDGIDPARGVSPSLLKTLERKETAA